MRQGNFCTYPPPAHPMGVLSVGLAPTPLGLSQSIFRVRRLSQFVFVISLSAYRFNQRTFTITLCGFALMFAVLSTALARIRFCHRPTRSTFSTNSPLRSACQNTLLLAITGYSDDSSPALSSPTKASPLGRFRRTPDLSGGCQSPKAIVAHWCALTQGSTNACSGKGFRGEHLFAFHLMTGIPPRVCPFWG